MALIFVPRPAHGLTTTITKITPARVITNSTDIEFEFISSAADAHFVCSLDYADPVFCTSPWSIHNLSDGQHRFQVNAVSDTEGMDYIGAVHIWTVDTIAPRTKVSAILVGQDSYKVDLLSSEVNSTFLCSLDGAPAAPCTTPYQWNNARPGNHYFRAQAVDEATNVDLIGADFSFTVEEQVSLTTTITSVEPSALFTNIAQVVFGFISNQSTAQFVCTLAGQTTPCVSPWSYSPLPDGLYAFTVQAANIYGSIDPIGATYSWTIDTVPPVGAVNLLNATSTVITVTWTSDEPATTELHWGPETDLSRAVPADSSFTTAHSVRITGLSSNSLYSMQPGGVDRAGNPYKMPRLTIRTKR